MAEERGLLARELHDSIAQSLSFLKIQVAAAARRAAARRCRAGRARDRRARRRRAREPGRRARAAGALPHPHQRRGHRAGAAHHAAEVRAPDRPGHAPRRSRATACRCRPTCRCRCCTWCRRRCPTCASTPRRAQVWVEVQQAPQLARRGARRRPRLRSRRAPSRRDPRRPAHHARARRSASAPTVEVVSVPGCGHLRRADAADARRRRSAQAAGGMSATTACPIRVLVVDDHTLFRRGLTALLARRCALRGGRRGRRRRRGAAPRRPSCSPT